MRPFFCLLFLARVRRCAHCLSDAVSLTAKIQLSSLNQKILRYLGKLMWIQKTFHLPAKSRGFHLITPEVLSELDEIRSLKVGMMTLLIQHTSASLTLNENADPTVRSDFSAFFDRLVPENAAYFEHTDEGPDDMPAHLKSSLLGATVTVPITNGGFNLGTWQGIYLCEHRNYGGVRTLVATIHGERLK